MLKIEVLGTGCPKCKALEKSVHIALEQTGTAAEVVKVEEIKEIVRRGVMMTPALAINGKVVSSGHILSPVQVAKFLEDLSEREN